jgi:hypothetical protein
MKELIAISLRSRLSIAREEKVRRCFFASCQSFLRPIEQEQKDDPTYYSDFVTLMGRMSKIEAAEHGLADRPSQYELKEFWQYELELTSGLPARRHRPRRTLKKSAAKS